jgi:hypothetical protein
VWSQNLKNEEAKTLKWVVKATRRRRRRRSSLKGMLFCGGSFPFVKY